VLRKALEDKHQDVRQIAAQKLGVIV
jgi:HEAT repeat protein